MSALTIRPDDLTDKRVLDLLALHLEEMHSWSPACKVHSLPPERLREADVSFYSAWEGDELAVVGALKSLDAKRGELKSMRAAPAFRGKGVGERLLVHLISEASARGYTWLGLETGRTVEFAAARTLYEQNGFAECPGFDDYVSDDFSVCMEKHL